MTHVVAVAALPGGGKTSVVTALARRLGDATAVHIDAYERVTRRPVEEILEWVRRGADCDELDIPGLASDLERLRRGESARDPCGTELAPRRFVLLETLYGREHTETGRFIDTLIWLEVPPELALARTLRSMAESFARHPEADARAAGAGWIATYLEQYLAGVRDALELQRRRVPARAERVLDGTRPLAEIVEDIATGLAGETGGAR